MSQYEVGQPSTEKDGIETPQMNQTPKERKSFDDDSYTKDTKRTSAIYQNPWPVITNDFFMPLRDLRMEIAEPRCAGSSTTMSEANYSLNKCQATSNSTNIGDKINKHPKRIKKYSDHKMILQTIYLFYIKSACVSR
jgi:hypothetical protein